MPKITSIVEANAALQPYVPLVSQLTGSDTTLDRIRPLMALLGNPQDAIKVVHIAGTSGKTSTAYFAAALLTSAGKRTGLTVSPHVDSVTERVQINGTPLSETSFCNYLSEFLELVETAPLQPSYFELLYAFSFWVFARENVDYAVVETGMGGLHDATNVADSPNKVCVITDIGYDHMHVLGDTLPEIAAQKAGIIHPGNQVIMYRQAPDIMAAVEARVTSQKSAHLLSLDAETEQVGWTSRLLPELAAYQQRNWVLAYAVYDFLRQRDALPGLVGDVLQATQRVQVPGRMDILAIGGKTVVMDGAHNGQKTAAFLDSFSRRFPGVRPVVLIALKKGKEPADVVPLIAAAAEKVIVTSFDTTQDLPAKSTDPAELASLFAAAGVPTQAIADQQVAVKTLLNDPASVVVVTGSFYLLSQLRAGALVP